jgi:hypothetical protein
VLEPFVSQQIRDPIGDRALGDAVQGQRHPPAGKRDLAGLDGDPLEPDAAQGGGDGAGRRPVRRGVGASEMLGMQAPERLDRRIERALREAMDPGHLTQYVDQLVRRRAQAAARVQDAQAGPGALQAEDVLEAVDLAEHLLDQRRAGHSSTCSITSVTSAPSALPRQRTVGTGAAPTGKSKGDRSGEQGQHPPALQKSHSVRPLLSARKMRAPGRHDIDHDQARRAGPH